MSDEHDSPDQVQFFKREEIVEKDQEGLAPIIDIFTKKRLNIKHDYRNLSTPSESREEKEEREKREEFWNDPIWKKSF